MEILGALIFLIPFIIISLLFINGINDDFDDDFDDDF
jgi:TRAP-type mannitol/chloroaromatic compound transport system permease small subunit